jgi:hypothetical protein
MADVDPSLIPLPEDQPPQPRDTKLPPLWTTKARAWFTFAESHFWLNGINDEQQNFNHVLSALPAETVSQVIHLLDTLPQTNPYEYFKTQLLDIHQLSDYEKFDMLTKIELMGGRKPSQLLHAMLEFCPVGMQKHISPSTTSSCRDFPRLSERSWERCSLAIACSHHQGRQAEVCPLSYKRRHRPHRRGRGECPSQHRRCQGW